MYIKKDKFRWKASWVGETSLVSVWNGVLAEKPKAVTFLWQNFYQCELFMVFSQQPGVPCPENSSPGVSIKQILKIWFPGKYRISIEWWLLELGEDLESEEKRRVEKVLSLPDFPGKLKTGISRDPNRAPLVLQEPRHAGCCWCAFTGATYRHYCFQRLWMRHQQAGAVLKLEGHAGKCHQPVRTDVGFNQQWIEPLSFFSWCFVAMLIHRIKANMLLFSITLFLFSDL